MGVWRENLILSLACQILATHNLIHNVADLVLVALQVLLATNTDVI
jgi:hypothetical protein